MAKVLMDVWSDYVCPFCYLQMPLVKRFGQEYQVSVRWRAFELRPEPVPTLQPDGEYLRRVWEGSVYPMAERQGMVLRLPPVQPRSRRAFETAEFARRKGKFELVHEALFKAFFEEGGNISETNILLDIAGAAGLDPLGLLGALEAREYVPKVLADQKLAHKLGIHAVPAMVLHFSNEPVESGLLATGTRSVLELEQLLEALKSRGLKRGLKA